MAPVVRTGYIGTESIGDVLTKANFDKLPGGLVGYASTTSDSTAAASVTTYTNMNPTITAGTSRLYKITISVSSVTQVGTTSGTGSLIQIWDLTGAVALAGAVLTPIGAVAGNYAGAVCVTLHAPSAGSQQYGFRYLSGATSIQMKAGATTPAYILVEEVGPAF